MVQKEIALQAMIEWLSHPGELGKRPSKIQQTKIFRYHDMNYYIFKFKKSFFSKWLIGVCGGYEDDSLENCGHVFSNFKEYNFANEEVDAKEMIDLIRNYWINRAKDL